MTTSEKPALVEVPASPAPAPVKAAARPAAKAQPKASPSATKKAPARAAKPAPAAPAAKPAVKVVTQAAVKSKAAPKPPAEKAVKLKKPKMVRDSLSIPKPEYAVLDALKLRAAKLASPAKKTELIRAGIKAIAAMADGAFLAAIKAVPSLKTGRPSKKKAA